MGCNSSFVAYCRHGTGTVLKKRPGYGTDTVPGTKQVSPPYSRIFSGYCTSNIAYPPYLGYFTMLYFSAPAVPGHGVPDTPIDTRQISVYPGIPELYAVRVPYLDLATVVYCLLSCILWFGYKT